MGGRMGGIIAGIAALLACAACTAHPAASVLPYQPASGTFKIKHVVWITQEDRSFDDLFAGYPGADASASGHAQYGYVPHVQATLYFSMAEQYVLADRMFTSNVDLSYVSRRHMVAGHANRAVDYPSRP